MTASQQHIRALDGLRWFAFLAVFLFHSHESLFGFGKYGVQVFFVLSGFLIGNILLTLRDEHGASVARRLKTFYMRRALRIFPVYYFLLLMIAILGSLHLLNPHFEVLPLHALYLTNFYLALTDARIDSQTHLWSLCVEEHFYLIAPIILLCFSYGRLASTVRWVIVSVLMARIANFFLWSNPRFDCLSPMQFDVLLIGVSAAIIMRRGFFLRLNAARLRYSGAVCGLATIALLIWAYYPSPQQRFAEATFLPPVLGIATGSCVSELWQGRLPRLAAFLSWGPFAYLGKISYGLYLYHNFLFVFARGSGGVSHELRLLGCLVLTIGVATASWYLLERPLLGLKRYYPYAAVRPAPSGRPRRESLPTVGLSSSTTER